MFPRSIEYAIRAMTYLARQPAGRLSGAREISETEKIPQPFLWKILRALARKKLVRSFKGVGGGYELARPATDISLREIVDGMDGADAVEGCVLGLADCSDERPCPLHSSWQEIRSRLRQLLGESTLASLAASGATRVTKAR